MSRPTISRGFALTFGAGAQYVHSATVVLRVFGIPFAESIALCSPSADPPHHSRCWPARPAFDRHLHGIVSAPEQTADGGGLPGSPGARGRRRRARGGRRALALHLAAASEYVDAPAPLLDVLFDGRAGRPGGDGRRRARERLQPRWPGTVPPPRARGHRRELARSATMWCTGGNDGGSGAGRQARPSSGAHPGGQRETRSCVRLREALGAGATWTSSISTIS